MDKCSSSWLTPDPYSWLLPGGYKFNTHLAAHCYVVAVIGMWSSLPAMIITLPWIHTTAIPVVTAIGVFFLCGAVERFLFHRAAAAGGSNPDPAGSRLGTRAQRACWVAARMHQRF